MQNKIEQLKAIAADETLSQELRAAAQQQLKDMGEIETEPQKPQDNTPPPSADFVEFCLKPIWNKLVEPPQFERWQRSPDCRERIRKHDAFVAAKLADIEATTPDEFDRLWMRVVFRLRHSWEWEHRRTNCGKYLMQMSEHSYELLGQCES
jgi:hypothetical protein